MQVDRKQRESNFELMRIFAMFLIIAYHYVLFSNLRFNTAELSFNRLFYQSMLIDGKTGVNLFVMVSGYFMVKSSGAKTSKVLQLWGQAFFYIMLIWVIFHGKLGGFGGGFMGSPQDTLMGKIFFLSSGAQWFIAVYLVMYLLTPYVNVMLNAMSRTVYRRLLVLTSVFWVLIPTISWIPGMVVTEFQGNNLLFFLYLYALGGYLRLYHSEKQKKASFWFLCALGMVVICMITVVAVDIWNTKSMNRLKLLDYLFNYQNHVFILLLSLFLFLGFKNLNMKHSRVVNYLSSLTFGIYLIHDNWQYRMHLWNDVAKGSRYTYSPWFPLISLGYILAVFVVCGGIEAVRQLTVEKIWMKFVGFISPKIDALIDKVLP